MSEAVEKTALMLALTDHKVFAQVIDLDHYRIRGGMAVETDYIIRVEPTENGNGPQFESFTLSKTYSSFRTLANQLKKIADNVMMPGNDVDDSTKKLAQYCETVHHLVETQRTQYLGKVNYNYVKVLAKKRSQIVQEVLDATLNHFPASLEGKKFSDDVAQTIETFFLCDHCAEVDEASKAFNFADGNGRLYTKSDMDDDDASRGSTKSRSKGGTNPIDDAVHTVGKFLKKTFDETPLKPKGTGKTTTGPSTPVVPITRKTRKSVVMRQFDEDELKQVGEEANLLLDDERHSELMVPSYSHPVPSFQSKGSKVGQLLENNPMIFALITVVVLTMLKRAAKLAVTVDMDILLLFMWAAFCVGLHTPRPMISGVDKYYGPPPSTPTGRMKSLSRKSEDRDGRKLLRMSMVTTPDSRAAVNAVGFKDEIEDDIMEINQSPLPRFPAGAELGTKNNCWSEPVCSSFHVRGPDYLKDKVKIESADFLFPVRGLDLFLTDTAPENAGSNPGVMGGRLRDIPTFVINFRLPWGLLLAYFEIPEMFVPFVKAGHDPAYDKSNLPSTKDMTPSQRCVARWCQGSQDYKNKTLKIVPTVVDGPWVVRSTVGSKPAIIGNKLPVNYVYQKDENGKALYLEADLDIVASSAARGILSMVRSYTQVLTLDLGFVVQGNKKDELPEQMLVGARLHGIDPLTAPSYPTTGEDIFKSMDRADTEDDDV
ncbi:DUF1336 domain containing protein [Nitzschia inconspicua]|uniref:DUF1336 domain containing protein n=1 Tax=Nitzschia inconspicua TaxID=303405 RepID=A0A9K3PI37_9STRA|nr:DUF1336 domain containing protein [Nitzschia inconspicua]